MLITNVINVTGDTSGSWSMNIEKQQSLLMEVEGRKKKVVVKQRKIICEGRIHQRHSFLQEITKKLKDLVLSTSIKCY